jgi:hypothetical protein
MFVLGVVLQLIERVEKGEEYLRCKFACSISGCPDFPNVIDSGLSGGPKQLESTASLLTGRLT